MDGSSGDTHHIGHVDLERRESHRTPLSRIQIISVMAPLAAGVFIASLDITIIVTALPEIASHFDSSQIYTWTGSSYALSHASTTTLWSMISDIWGRKPILFCALGAFFAGSIICAFVDDVKGFIAGRALQGAGAGGLTTMANICISDLFSLRERGLYFGILSVVMAFASGIGPSLGGVFTERLSWQWCFYINLPISALAFVLLLASLPLQNPKTPIWQGLKAIDWLGTLLVTSGTLMFLLGLTFGGVEYPWSSITVVSLAVAGIVVIGLFLLTEWKLAKYPMVPLNIFRSGSSVASFAICFSHGIVLMGVGFYVPLYFQAVLATGPLLAGVYVLPYVISVAGGAACTGVYIQRSGTYIVPVYLGLAMTILGSGLMIDLEQDYNWVKIVLYQIAAGIGLGINFEPALISLQAATHPDDIAAATSTFAFVRSLSTAISIVIGGVLFQNQMQDKANALIASLGQAGYTEYQGSDVLANIYVIDKLPQYQQVVIRSAVHESLTGVWIMYTAFAGLGALAGIFVAVHPLSNIHKSVVLGLPGKQGSFKSVAGNGPSEDNDK
ncbi:major facilitator superfamily domain-containing protein [Microdochium trichocladiopsis]|uniref:Major facilitator superfamily domain-containing protein n=1 Tax=Microdochium trichocladiopsis TaxID=1682393 RepID=A0A9P8YI26_9PEZI|nr:major facilitator superfamily domain-containing protein [Microdochium trichocladiopsis]KAH7040403.1 major facilitator superfamily domain-containing protein [Microdochium trichocladiopsis]